MKIRYEYVNLPEGVKRERLGFCDFQKYEGDLYIGGLTNYVDSGCLEVSYPTLFDGFYWLVPIASPQPFWKNYLKLFNYGLLLRSLGLVIVITSSLHFIANRISELRKYRNFWDCGFITFQTFLQQSIPIFPIKLQSRIIFCFWISMTYILITILQGLIVARIHFQLYDKQITNFKELMEANLKIAIADGGNHFFDNKTDPIDKYISENSFFCNDCYDRVVYKKDAAILKTRTPAVYRTVHEYLDADGKPMIYYFKKPFVNIFYRIGYTKSFPLVEDMDKIIFRLWSAGIVRYIMRISTEKIESTYRKAQNSNADFSTLNVDSVLGCFYILIFGWLIAFIVFICEILLKVYTNYSRKKVIIFLK